MSSYFIGQPVRIVCAEKPENAHMVGAEARITEIKTKFSWVMYGLNISPIRIDVVDGGRMIWHGWADYQLEPIIPDGAKPSEFSYEELMDRCRDGVAA